MTRQERRERELAERRQVIVDAARELAEAEGWEAVTTRRLGRPHRVQPTGPLQPLRGKRRHRDRGGARGILRTGDPVARCPPAAGSAEAEPRAVAFAYLEFARANPALYEAMFAMDIDLRFAQSDTAAPLHGCFVELRDALAPLAGVRDVETFTEIVWSGLHGLATLSRAGRLRPDFDDQRLSMLMDRLSPSKA